MLINIDLSRRPVRAAAAASTALLAICCLASCTTAGEKSAAAQPLSTSVEIAHSPEKTTAPLVENSSDVLSALMVYVDKIRNLQAQELTQEITQLSNLGNAASPKQQLQLTLALMQTKQTHDLVRAQDLLQQVLLSTDGQAYALQPLARLLAIRFAEQRRLEELLERQSQQLRDTQRRLDQTNDKLEALKEIERSLTPRPSASSAATTSRSRTRPTTP